jgi:ankyrin repeat protein
MSCLNFQGSETGFLTACRNGFTEIVEFMLPYVDVNSGESPLIVAARESRLAVVRILASTGIDVERLNDAGESALDIAASNGDSAMFQLLFPRYKEESQRRACLAAAKVAAFDICAYCLSASLFDPHLAHLFITDNRIDLYRLNGFFDVSHIESAFRYRATDILRFLRSALICEDLSLLLQAMEWGDRRCFGFLLSYSDLSNDPLDALFMAAIKD